MILVSFSSSSFPLLLGSSAGRLQSAVLAASRAARQLIQLQSPAAGREEACHPIKYNFSEQRIRTRTRIQLQLHAGHARADELDREDRSLNELELNAAAACVCMARDWSALELVRSRFGLRARDYVSLLSRLAPRLHLLHLALPSASRSGKGSRTSGRRRAGGVGASEEATKGRHQTTTTPHTHTCTTTNRRGGRRGERGGGPRVCRL